MFKILKYIFGRKRDRKNISKSKHHHVYVIQLRNEVLEIKKFRNMNPQYKSNYPCVYVGMTGLTPKKRFLNHRKGYKSNRFVKKYGLELLPELYEKYNPMSYEEAQEKEKWLAGFLRRQGYGVWQN